MCVFSAALNLLPHSIRLIVTHDGNDALMAEAAEGREYPCLIRAMNGKEVKFSTRVRSLGCPTVQSLNSG